MVLDKSATDASPDVESLCHLWADVLGVQEVRPDDDFFSLGGDSVAIMIMLMRLEETYGTYLEQADIFDAPTPNALLARMTLTP